VCGGGGGVGGACTVLAAFMIVGTDARAVTARELQFPVV